MIEQEIYTIGEVAMVTGLSAKTLRYYDSIGLVVPAIRNPENNYRLYSKEQIIVLNTIKRLRNIGCGLKEISAVIEKMILRPFPFKSSSVWRLLRRKSR